MKKIKLQSISFKNFKLFKEFNVEVDSNNLVVEGANGTGKTTILDGFMWLLFDKTSDGSSKTEAIKPKDKKGEQYHFLDTSVDAQLVVDNVVIKLTKTLKEKWVTKRGEEEQVFSGHTTDYEIDDVPKSQKEYKDYIDSIVSEEDFRLITDVRYFNNLSNDRKREIILSLTSNVKDLDIAKNNKKFKVLEKELENKTIEDLNKQYKKGVLDLGKKIEELQVRYDENAKKDFKDIENLEVEEVKAKLLAIQNELAELKVQLASGDNTKKVKELELEIRSKQLDIKLLEHCSSPKAEKLANLSQDIKKEVDKKNDYEYKGKSLKREIENNEAELLRKQSQIERLYSEYDLEEAKEFSADKCSYCHQDLPAEKLEELRVLFNNNKVATLESIISSGKVYREGTEKLEAQNKDLQKQVEETRSNYAKSLNKIKELVDAQALVQEEQDINPHQEKINALHSEIKALEEQIEALSDNQPKDNTKEALLDHEEINLQELVAKFKEQDEVAKRLKELNEELDKTISRKAEGEKFLILLEAFTIYKAEFLESQINDNFEFVSFKLFENQINGGIRPICEATYNGKSYPFCSTGEKVIVGLDIIRTIQKLIKVQAPIFIDNAESITIRIDLGDNQTIKMYAVRNVDKITYEIEEKTNE